jgi:hypothetical protein
VALFWLDLEACQIPHDMCNNVILLLNYHCYRFKLSNSSEKYHHLCSLVDDLRRRACVHWWMTWGSGCWVAPVLGAFWFAKRERGCAPNILIRCCEIGILSPSIPTQIVIRIPIGVSFARTICWILVFFNASA